VDAELRLVISNVPDAPVLARAATLGVAAKVVNHREFPTRAEFERALIAELERFDIGLVCLAGFMRILSPVFVDRYPNRILNIHPSLLPAFAGLHGAHVHQAVIAAGVKVSGCTVHFVSNELDCGPIVVQRAIPVRDTDTPESLAVRVLVEEHRAYADAVEFFCSGRLAVEGRRVVVRES
jgi:phosphoribosylglycinamide formyltransferase-1